MILWQALQLGSSRVGLAKRADATGSSGRSPIDKMSVAKNSSNTLRARWRLRLVGVVSKRFKNMGDVSTPDVGYSPMPPFSSKKRILDSTHSASLLASAKAASALNILAENGFM